MTNPLQQASEHSAATATLKGTSLKPDSPYAKFHAEVGRQIFDATKYGVAISKKLQAVTEEGALENPEFKLLLHKFATTAIILAATAGTAVTARGLSPGKDLQVIATIEDLVAVATAFIPLVERLYNAYEGKVTPVSTLEEVQVGETEKATGGIFENAGLSGNTSTETSKAADDAGSITNAAAKFQPATFQKSTS